MSALARTTEINCDSRAANEDYIDGGSRTRTKFTYAYDANGNVSSRNGSIIGSTSYNYPSGVSTATESATFDYGPDRQRWRMVYTGPTGNETTYYATPMFEVVHTSSLTDYRHYIFAGGRVVMQLSRSVNGASQRPLLTDHQGSISTIMHGTGTSFVDESFTPYGNRREASTWTGNPTSTELANMSSITRQGYTFQTVLATMHLNHMNGRIEDSITGRFLSPDPYTPDPSDTQDYNRYSYVDNNPVTLVDPTGFDSNCPNNNCVLPNNPVQIEPGTPDILVMGTRPGVVTTNFAPGGFLVTAPDGSETIVGIAQRPAKISSGVAIQPQGGQTSQNQHIPCPSFAEDLAARRDAANTSMSDALAGASMVNDLLGGAADVAGKASKAGQTASFLEGAGRLSTVFGAGYTAYQGSVALRTHNPDAIYDAGFGGTALAVAAIPGVGPFISFGMGAGNILGRLILPPEVPEGPLSRYATQCHIN